MSACLVTGGAGFIGSSIARALLRRGDRVRILDDFSSGKRENLLEMAGHVPLLPIEMKPSIGGQLRAA